MYTAPVMPLGDDDMRRKFLDLVGSVTDRANAGLIHAAWSDVAGVADVAQLTSLPS